VADASEGRLFSNDVSDRLPLQSILLTQLKRQLGLAAGLRDAALALLYPSACQVCGAMIESWRDGVACAQCWQAIERSPSNSNLCAKCGLPLMPLDTHSEVTARRCGQCQDWAFTCARSCGPYEGALRESVLWLKLHPHLAPRLRGLLRATFAALSVVQASETIIPVPLHPARLRERGFNQAELIARALAAVIGLYVDTASVVRVKATDPHRAGMGAEERARSLKGAFRVRAPRLIEGRAVLLIDDVMTSGTTVHEMSQALFAGGARAVSVLTLARATSHFN